MFHAKVNAGQNQYDFYPAFALCDNIFYLHLSLLKVSAAAETGNNISVL